MAAILAIGIAIYLGLVAGGPTWPVFTVLVAAAPLLLLALTNAGEWLVTMAGSRRPKQCDQTVLQIAGGAQVSKDEK